MGERFADDFKRFFFRGLAAGLPALLTVVILVWFFAQVNRLVGRYINVAVKWVAVQATCIFSHVPLSLKGAAEQWEVVTAHWEAYHLGWVGFALVFVVIYVLGRFVASILGRGLWRMLERALLRVPVIKQVYPLIKQVTDYFLSTRHKIEFSRVVAVEYPRKGTWSVGLVTGAGMKTIADRTHDNLLTVFIPSSPTPITGYTVTVSRNDVIDLPIDIEEALRFTVSAGVIMPLPEQLSQDETSQARQGTLPDPAGQQKENTE